MKTILERFWSRVAAGPAEACWLWTGETNSKGYGRFNLYEGKHGRMRVLAHRFAYEVSTREPIQARALLHVCDTPCCCNPSHLRVGTQLDNIRDALAKGRMDTSGLAIGWAIKRNQTHCKNGHVLGGDNLIPDRKCRRCRICRDDYMREYRRGSRNRKDGAT